MIYFCNIFYLDENGYETVHVLTDDDIARDTFTIYDVVLPLPGYDVTYPANKIYKYYKTTLAEDGLDIENMRRKEKDFSLPGKYRYILFY